MCDCQGCQSPTTDVSLCFSVSHHADRFIRMRAHTHTQTHSDEPVSLLLVPIPPLSLSLFSFFLFSLLSFSYSVPGRPDSRFTGKKAVSLGKMAADGGRARNARPDTGRAARMINLLLRAPRWLAGALLSFLPRHLSCVFFLSRDVVLLLQTSVSFLALLMLLFTWTCALTPASQEDRKEESYTEIERERKIQRERPEERSKKGTVERRSLLSPRFVFCCRYRTLFFFSLSLFSSRNLALSFNCFFYFVSHIACWL